MLLRPRALQKGDKVGLVAPCYAAEADFVRSAVVAVEKQGLVPMVAPHMLNAEEGFAAALDLRLADFNAFLRDDSIAMILFDGGEVCNQMLSGLDYEAFAKHPKWIATYSDGTSIANALSARCGVQALYGPAPSVLMGNVPYNMEQFTSWVFGDGCAQLPKAAERTSIHPGKAEGQLIGGYLVNFALLCDSPYLPLEAGKDYLLFLEERDCFNPPAAAARYLWHIGQSRLMQQVKGVVIGSYSNEPSEAYLATLRRFAAQFEVPCLLCEEFGHGYWHGILPIGADAALDADAGTLMFLR